MSTSEPPDAATKPRSTARILFSSRTGFSGSHRRLLSRGEPLVLPAVRAETPLGARMQRPVANQVGSPGPGSADGAFKATSRGAPRLAPGLHRVHGRQAYRPLLIRDFGCAGLTGIGPVRQRTWYSRLGLLSSELHGRGLLIPSTGIVVVAETMGHERLAMTANGSSQPGACWMRRAGTPVELRLERIAVQSGWARHGGHLAGQALGQSSSRLSTRARPRRP